MASYTRLLAGVCLVWIAGVSGRAEAQTVGVHAAAGPTLVDSGYSFAAGANYSPTDLLTLLFQYDHSHTRSRTSSDGRGLVTTFRGGTLSLASAELRVTPFRLRRIGPYGLAGLAFGVSRPNVTEDFPNRITNRAGGIMLGGGMHFPIGSRAAAYADGRIIVGAEGLDGMFGVAPLRAGVMWRF